MAAFKPSPPENILGDDLCLPRLRNREDMSFVPPRYSYIKKLIPLVLDLYQVQYSCWSALFRDTARHYNLLHHIDPTFTPQPNLDTSIDTTLWGQQDPNAVVLSWIYATISPYLLVRLNSEVPYATSAMHAWTCLRDMCQQHDNNMQSKKRRFIHIDLNEDYQSDVNDDGDRVDLISALPDHLLVYMLFLVDDMKTVGRTCLLSKRWTHLWTHLMDLDFKDPETFGLLNCIDYAQPEMDKFVDRVNRVIKANRAPYLDTLRIYFPLTSSYSAHIHNWLEFAFVKKVIRSLDLNFGPMTYPNIHFQKIFSNNPALSLNTSLTSIHLKSATIKGPLVQWFLTSCVSLQRLSLHCCRASADDDTAKRDQKLVVSSLQLKHLECFGSLNLLGIKVLHLSAPNLTSLILYESEIDVEYHSVPSLVDATFGGSYSYQIFEDLDSLSGFSSQLEKLSIRWWYRVSSVFSHLPTFVNVKQLEIVYEYKHDDLIRSTSLIEACPLLHTFKLKMMAYSQQAESMRISAPNYAQEKAICCHKHLKVVEYLGYAGCALASELAICLVRLAPMLQRFIFYTRRPRYIENLREGCTFDSRDRTEILKRTELLAERIQRQFHVDVVIL